MNYLIEIKFSNGNEAHIRVSGKNQDEAIRRIQDTEEFVSFANDNGEVERIVVNPIEVKGIDYSRFELSQIGNSDWFVVKDTKNKISIEFKKGKYNDRKNISIEDPEMDGLELATALREIGEYIAKHSDLI